MTIANTLTSVRYVANGVTTFFAFNNRVISDTDITVVLFDTNSNPFQQVLGTDYSVVNVGADTGCSVQFVTAPQNLWTVDIRTNTDNLQSSDIKNQGAFFPEIHEDALDKLTREVQDLTRKTYTFGFHGPDRETIPWPALPIASQRAGYAVGFDSSGLPALFSQIPTGSLTRAAIGNLSYPVSTAETNAGSIPVDTIYPYGDPLRYGVVGDGVTDDTAALRAWARVPGFKFGRNIVCKISGTINFLTNETIPFNGMAFDGSAGGTFTNGNMLLFAGTINQIAGLSVSPVAYADSLTFGAAHNLNAEDVCIIYNPTNSSWSTKQTYYRAGEYFRVEYVSSPMAVKIWDALYWGYTAANVIVLQIPKNEIEISDVTVMAPNTGTISPIKIQLATKVRMVNCKATGSDYTGFNIDRCYDVQITDCSVTVPVQVAASKYAVSIGNSQHLRIRGGEYRSFRHCFNIGGDDFQGCVPCRDIRISNLHAANDAAGSQSLCLSSHANGENLWFENIDCIGGAEFGGRNIHYININFRDQPYGTGALIYGGSEWHSGIAEARGCTIYGSQAYTQGLVRLFTDANTAGDSNFLLDNLAVEMPLCDTLARVDMTASVYKVNASVTNVRFISAPNLAQILRMVGTGSGGAGDYVVVDDIVNAPSGAVLLTQVSSYAATRKKLMQQGGTVAVTPASAAATANAAVTFRYPYGTGITPFVTVSGDQRVVNAKATICSAASIASTGFTATIQTGDNANFGATSPVVNVQYVAGVSE